MDEKVEKYNGNMRKGTSVLVFIMGSLFAFFTFSEYKLATSEDLVWNLRFACLISAISVTSGVLFVYGAKLILYIKEKSIFRFPEIKKQIPAKYVFAGSFLLTVLAWLPVYLAYYPGICAYDATIQFGQIFNHQYNTHHPLFHTLFIEKFINLGETLFHSQNAGIGVQTFVQLLLLALAFAYMLYVLTKLGMRLFGQIICQVLFMFYCLNLYMVVSVTKDVLFSAFIIIFLSALCIMYKEKSIVHVLLLLISGIGLCLFRNNGIFAVAFVPLVLLVVFFTNKKDRATIVKQFVACIIIILASKAMLNGLADKLNAEPGDPREMMSVPIQQFARVMVNNGQSVNEEEKAMIDDFIMYEAYLNYNPIIADPVKGRTRSAAILWHLRQYVKLYLELLSRYPSDFINAYLELIGGYISPFDETFMYDDISGERISREYIRHVWTHRTGDYGDEIFEAPILPKLKEKLDDFARNDSYYVPVVKWLYVPGVFIWLYFASFIVAIDKRRINVIVPLVFAIGLYATILVGPTMNMRYLFPLIAALPLFAGGVLCRSNS